MGVATLLDRTRRSQACRGVVASRNRLKDRRHQGEKIMQWQRQEQREKQEGEK